MTDRAPLPASLQDRVAEIQHRVTESLAKVDPHHRLVGRPVTYRLIDGQTFEITYRDVPSIAEAEVLGVKRLIGDECFCSVSPQTSESLTVRFVVPVHI